nr:hypothetical protein [Tanacetum cinerariifolium]
MSSLFAKTHNVVAILEKSDAAEGFEQIIDFLIKRSGDVTRLQALVDKKKIVISEVVIREILQLNDVKGAVCFPNEEIFACLAQMGYEKPSTKLTFYKAFFSSQWKFLIHTILQSLSAKRTSWNEFSTAMASVVICLSKEAQVPAQGDNVQEPAAEEVVLPTPTPPSPPSLVIPSLPPHQPSCPPQPQDAEGSSLLFQQVLATCSTLTLRVEGLENDKAAQQLEIVKLKARVKKLEKINKVKSSKLRRLKKVGTSQRVDSSDEMENVFNQGRIIVDMDQDEGIELVADKEKDAKFERRHVDKQAEIYNIDLDHSSKVQEAVEIVTTAKLMTEVVTTAATQVVAASTPISAAKPKILTITAAPAVSTRRRKGVVIRDPEEELPSDTPAKTPKKYDEILPIFQAKFDANMRFLFKSREQMEAEDEEIIKSINETPAQKAAKRRKLSKEAQEAKDLRKRLKIVYDEDDDVFVEATPLEIVHMHTP